MSFKYSPSSPAEKAIAPHSSTLAWKIPWTEEPGGLQSMGSLRVRHDWATSLSFFTFMHWRRKWQPTVLAWRIPGTGEPGGLPSMGSQSQTWLKRLRSSSSSSSSSSSPATNLCSVSTKLPILDISYQWTHIGLGLCDWRLSLSAALSRFIHMVAGVCALFLLMEMFFLIF